MSETLPRPHGRIMWYRDSRRLNLKFTDQGRIQGDGQGGHGRTGENRVPLVWGKLPLIYMVKPPYCSSDSFRQTGLPWPCKNHGIFWCIFLKSHVIFFLQFYKLLLFKAQGVLYFKKYLNSAENTHCGGKSLAQPTGHHIFICIYVGSKPKKL